MKRTMLHMRHKTLMSGIAMVGIVAAVAMMSGSPVEKSWAQDMPPQPMTITAPAPETGVVAAPMMSPTAPDSTVTADPALAAPADPMAGLPSAPGTETQSAKGTYEALNPEDFTKLDEAMSSMAVMRKETVKPAEVGTLVFTLWQHSLLQDAKKLFVTRRPTESEIAAAADGSAVEEARPRGIREIGLNGILYKGKDNWVVWLNGKRLAPNAVPKEVMDIKVSKDYIDLKWFDAYSNLIYPIRIRPHQRFNLDSRIFLPGITADAAAQLQAASTGTP